MKWNISFWSKEEKEMGINFPSNAYLLNYSRIRLFNFIFLLCNGIILILNFYNHSKGIGNKNPFSQYYIPAYLTFFSYFFIMSVLSSFKPPNALEHVRWWHKSQIYLFSLVMIIWVSTITFIDLRVNGGITVFALGIGTSCNFVYQLFMGFVSVLQCRSNFFAFASISEHARR